jgi:hypothetical protein
MVKEAQIFVSEAEPNTFVLRKSFDPLTLCGSLASSRPFERTADVFEYGDWIFSGVETAIEQLKVVDRPRLRRTAVDSESSGNPVFGGRFNFRAQAGTDEPADVPYPFDERYSVNPNAAVEKLCWDVSFTGTPTARDATRFLFSHLVDAPPPEQHLLYSAIVKISSPSLVFDVAWEEYSKFGYEGRLIIAANTMSMFEARAWDVLNKIVALRVPECEYFVFTITYLRGISRQQRLALLAELAMNPDISTQWRVLEAVGQFPQKESIAVLQNLTQSDSPDVRAEATERLSEINH